MSKLVSPFACQLHMGRVGVGMVCVLGGSNGRIERRDKSGEQRSLDLVTESLGERGSVPLFVKQQQHASDLPSFCFSLISFFHSLFFSFVILGLGYSHP